MNEERKIDELVIESSETTSEHGIKVLCTVSLISKDDCSIARLQKLQKVRRMFNSWMLETEERVRAVKKETE